MLFSGGKDSVLMLHLARKAFAPAPVPFPIMHVDTGHNFPEVIEFRDRTVAELRAAAGGGLGAGPDRLRPDQSRPPAGKPQPPPDRGAAGRDPERRLRRRLRRRPPRRGQGAGQGAGALLPRQLRPVGPEEPAPRALAPLQRPPPQGRAHPRLPDLRLDRARRLALPGARAGRPAADLLRPRARGGRGRGPADGRQRVLPAARGRRAEPPDGPLPDRRRRDQHRRRRARPRPITRP